MQHRPSFPMHKLSQLQLQLCRAHIKLRLYGGAYGIKLLHEVIRLDKAEQSRAFEQLINEIQSGSVKFRER